MLNKSSFLQNQKGLTLLEVLVASTILLFITVYTYESLRGGLTYKKKLEDKTETAYLLKVAARTLSEDVRKSFNHQDISYELYQRVKVPGLLKEGPPAVLTHFQGDKNSLHFTTSNHTRTLAHSLTSNLAEVSYYIKECSYRGLQDLRGPCLWRRVSPFLDEDVTQGEGEASVLLEGVAGFELQYMDRVQGGGELRWEEQWESHKKDPGQFLSYFPHAVKIDLSIYKNLREADPEQTLQTSLVVPLNFPNNVKKYVPPQPRVPPVGVPIKNEKPERERGLRPDQREAEDEDDDN